MIVGNNFSNLVASSKTVKLFDELTCNNKTSYELKNEKSPKNDIMFLKHTHTHDGPKLNIGQ